MKYSTGKKVETIKDYGAFVDLGDGVSGLVHISQISLDRIKHPSVVLKEGQEVQVKVIGNKDGKIKPEHEGTSSGKRRRGRSSGRNSGN